MRVVLVIGVVLALGIPAAAQRSAPAPATLTGVDELIADARYDEALTRTDAVEARAADQPGVLARVELARGSVWQARGFPRAVEHFDKARSFAETSGAAALAATVYGALAAVYGELGHWDFVLDFTERQHEADPGRTPEIEFRYHLQRGIAFTELQDRGQAESALRQALDAARRSNSETNISTALGELATLALEVDRDLPAALRFYDEALASARRDKARDLEARWLLDSGAALRGAGDYASARARVERAIALERASGVGRVTPAALKNLAQIQLHDHDLAGARASLAQAREHADRRNLRRLAWEVRIEQAMLERDTDQVLAARYFNEALAILDDTKGSVLVEPLPGGAWSKAFSSADPYDLAIDFLLDQGNAADAFYVAERGRARAFLETLRSAGDVIARDLPPEYVLLEAALLADISEAQAALRLSRRDAAKHEALNAAIRADEEQLNALRLRLAADRPAVSAARYPQLFAIADLQRKTLRPNQALIMFSLGASESTIWSVESGTARVNRLPAEAEIERAVRAYLSQIRRPGSPEESQRAADVFSLLLPGFSVGAGVTELIVIPHGILYDLPFEALRDRNGQRVIERFAVTYAPSASTYALLANRPADARGASTLLALGNPATATEMRDIARLYGPSARILEGGAATEPALRTADLSNVSVLHFATPGLVDAERPERSGLVLTAAPPDDGVLQMRELYALRLNRALVTLSASETARGQNVRGEGIVGLSRAFFYAGAEAVVASLWRVSDRSTARLLTDFYEALGRGLPAAEALRQAKLRLLQNTDWHDPFFWAAFVVSGNGAWNDAPPEAPSRRPLLVSSLVALVGLTGASAIWWVRRTRRISRRSRSAAAGSREP